VTNVGGTLANSWLPKTTVRSALGATEGVVVDLRCGIHDEKSDAPDEIRYWPEISVRELD